MIDILIQNGIIITVDKDRRIISDGAIAIKKDKIVEVGKSNDLRKKYTAKKNIDASKKLVIPGLIDAHVHLHHSLGRGLFSDMDFRLWLERIWHYYRVLNEEICYISSMLSFIEMVKTGTTCFAECGTVPTLDEPVVKAAKEIGIRGIISRCSMDLHGKDNIQGLPDYFKENTEQVVKEAELFFKRWHDTAGGKIKAWFYLHVLTNVSDKLCVEIKRLASEYQVGILVHAGMDEASVNLGKKLFGLPDIERLDRLDVLGPNVQTIHMGWINNKEFHILKEKDVKVCHSPSSSLALGYGNISRGLFPEMINAGITVSLGCDGPNCSNYLDMIREMYLAAVCHKEVRRDPKIMPAETALELATINGAKALLWENEIGSIEEGKKADIAILDIMRPEWIPSHQYNFIRNLVYSATGDCVDTTIIDGKVIMEGGIIRTINERKILEKGQELGQRVLEEMVKEGWIKQPWNFQ